MCFTLSSVSSPEDECVSSAWIHCPFTPFLLPASYRQIHLQFLKTHSCMQSPPEWQRNTHIKPFPEKLCFCAPPSHIRLTGEGNTSQTVALKLMSCLCMGFQQMQGGGGNGNCRGVQEERRSKGKCARDRMMAGVRKDWALLWHHLAVSCQDYLDYLTGPPDRCIFIEDSPDLSCCTRLFEI